LKRVEEVAELRGKSVEEINRLRRTKIMAELKVTLKRSIIGRPQNQRDTVKALGLKQSK
jgi:hypothetical protein